jgi:hypothetical protein
VECLPEEPAVLRLEQQPGALVRRVRSGGRALRGARARSRRGAAGTPALRRGGHDRGDPRFYERTYDAAPGQLAWEAARDAAAVPAVTRITMAQDSRGRPMRLLERNDSVFSGGSQSICYQPMFGYLLERMPVGLLREGGPLQPAGTGELNVKNPACYTYPQANGCRPGDHFMLPQHAEAERFLDYRPFAFEQPAWQRAASGISLAAALLALGLALRAVLSAIARRKSR